MDIVIKMSHPRLYIVYLFLWISHLCKAQNEIRVYLLPGIGSDERIFEKIRLDNKFTIIHLNYPVPPKNCSMKDFARILLNQIDTNGRYVLIGVSIGGMICSELKELTKPEEVIIISSAKCRGELPFRYRFQKTIPIHKLMPAFLIKGGARLLQPIVEPDRKKNKSTFKAMLRAKNKTLMKRHVAMVVNWDKKHCDQKIVHIHGSKDHTLPFRHLEVTHPVPGGSHMMALTKGDEINRIILAILNSKE